MIDTKNWHVNLGHLDIFVERSGKGRRNLKIARKDGMKLHSMEARVF